MNLNWYVMRYNDLSSFEALGYYRSMQYNKTINYSAKLLVANITENS